MAKNPIDEVLSSQNFSPSERKAFLDIVKYAKTCQKIGNIEALKGHVEQTIIKVVSNGV